MLAKDLVSNIEKVLSVGAKIALVVGAFWQVVTLPTAHMRVIGLFALLIAILAHKHETVVNLDFEGHIGEAIRYLLNVARYVPISVMVTMIAVPAIQEKTPVWLEVVSKAAIKEMQLAKRTIELEVKYNGNPPDAITGSFLLVHNGKDLREVNAASSAPTANVAEFVFGEPVAWLYVLSWILLGTAFLALVVVYPIERLALHFGPPRHPGG